MHNLENKICEIKKYLIDKDISKIKKLKLNLLKPEFNNLNSKGLNLVNEYNYYVKLIKKLQRHIKLNKEKDMLINLSKDRFQNLICIVITIDFRKRVIGIPVDINILCGDMNKVSMECTCYEIMDYSTLYIDNFKSRISNKGYGSIILKGLDKIINDINKKLIKSNIGEIKYIEGMVVADKNIISETNLINLYKKYGFKIDNKNNMIKYL